MGDTNKVDVKIGADISGLRSGMGQAANAVRDGVAQINGHFSSLTVMLGGIGAAMAGIGTILGGGKLFKDAIDETVKWTTENVRLARVLGITTEEASVLNVAIGDVLATTDQYVRGVQMMVRQINAGGKGFKDLGIEVRDSQGHLRPATVLMTEAIEKLNGLKAGTDRNVAAQKIWGRGWLEVMPVLKLTSEAMEEAKTKAEALGLVVGPEQAAKVRAYRIAMHEVHEVFDAIKIMVGNALLPVLLQMGQWFAQQGPTLMAAFKVAVRAVIEVFMVLGEQISENMAQLKAWYQSVLIYFGAIVASADGLKTVFGSIADAFDAMAHFDSAGMRLALDGIRQGTGQLAAVMEDKAKLVGLVWQGAFEDIGVAQRKLFADTKALWNPKAGKGGSVAEGGTTGDSAGDAAAAAARIKGEKIYQAYLLESRKTTHEQIVALLNAEEDAEKEHDAARLAAARQKATEDEAFYGKGSAEAIRAMQHVADVERDIDNSRRDNAKKLLDAKEEYELAGLAIEEDAIRQRYELGELSSTQELEQLAGLEARKYAIQRAGIEAQLADARLTATQRQLLNQELERLEIEHGAAMVAIDTQTSVRLKGITDDFVSSWTSSWAQGIEAMLNGTMKLSDGVRGIFTSLRDAVLQTLAKMATDWIAMELKKFVFFVATKIRELAVKKSIDAQSKASTVSTALTEISARGASAAAGAADSAAKIPYVGWAIAIGAAAAVLASVLSFKSNVGSAAGGWDIGLENPMAQLHKKEMVLPAHLAERVRNMTEGGGQAGTVVNLHVSTMDAKSFEGTLRQNDSALVRVLTELVRNGRAPKLA